MPDLNLLNKHALTEQFSTSFDNIQEWHLFYSSAVCATISTDYMPN